VTSLTTEPLATVLDQLLAGADATKEAFRQEMSRLSPDELAAWSAGARDTRTAIDFDTSFGVTTGVLGTAVKDNNGIKLFTHFIGQFCETARGFA
jgi:hypothetical protein